MGIGRLLDISVRTMSTYQRAIDVAAQNISNAGNPEYTRQKVLFANEVGEQGKGIGVKIQDVMRIRNDILDSQLRKYQSTYSDSEKRSEVLKQIEAIISEPSANGLNTFITEFFNSWDSLASNPNSQQLRLTVIQKAQALSTRFKDTIDGFNEIQYMLQQDAYVQVNNINSYLKEIYQLNQKVYDAEARGTKANELKDQRDALIDKLSKIVNITVQKTENGSVSVNVGGIFGADQTNFNEFEVKMLDGQLRLVAKNDSKTFAFVNAGEFYAVTDLFSNKINSYKAAYENLAKNFVEQVNSLHIQGYTLPISGSSQTNIPFFGELNSGGQIVNAFVDGEIKINSAILSDPRYIAVSSVAGYEGDNSIAIKIAELSKAKIPELGNQTFAENYTSIINTIAQEKVKSDNSIVSNELVVQNLKNQKQSYSGVSLDEEMTNVMKYQRSYEASAKLIKIADEILETIVNLI
ncbi:MAG: flagellar hook-associated protein FlgK [Melioribacteraceae bacterium]|nr:flagellar hook-associated protein FlgK [Melioribacteraceae bacterium]